MMFDAPRFARVRELFDEASELLGEAREAFLAQHGEDAEVLAAVRSLLASHEAAAEFLSRPAAELILDGRDGDDPLLGFALASYRITGALGEGGMGAVYRAQQESPRREVALKVIRGGWSTPGLRRRFALESATLGKLRHPGIAQIFEAGSAPGPDGRDTPFFAMELVEGPTLTTYTKGLGVRERLSLVAMVCDAAHHAHQKGVIHRDLKPANILVEDHAGSSTATGPASIPGVQPKILDFGVARLVEPDGAIVTLRTDPGQVIGTLAYMAPEQIRGDADRIDTRADVYALGVILYEALAGRLPMQLKGKSIAEAARIVEDQEPAALGAVDRSLRGDVATIVAKAMEKDPERRYSSAAELAADIRRFLADLPISASPATTAYKLRKFAARHTTLVGGVVTAFVLLVAGIVGTSIGLVRAREATRLARLRAHEAEVESRTAQRTADFLASVFSSADPANAMGREFTVKEAIDDAAALLDIELRDEPEVALRTRLTLCKTYLSLAKVDQAAKQADEAIRIAESLGGKESLSYTRAVAAQAAAARAARSGPEGVKLSRQALAGFLSALAPDDPQVARAKIALADALIIDWKHREAESLLREAKTALDARDDPASVQCTVLLASILSRRLADSPTPRTAEAMRLLDESLVIAQNRGAAGSLDRATLLSARGEMRRRDRDFVGAAEDCREALQIRQKVYPALHPRVTTVATQLAANLRSLQRHEESIAIVEPLVLGLREAKRTSDYTYASLVNEAAISSRYLGRDEAATAYYSESLSYFRAMKNKIMQTVVLGDLAELQLKAGRFAEAESAIREAMALAGSETSTLPILRMSLSSALSGQGRHDDAAAELAMAISTLRTMDPGGKVLREAMGLRLEELTAGGHLEEAKAQKAEIEELPPISTPQGK